MPHVLPWLAGGARSNQNDPGWVSMFGDGGVSTVGGSGAGGSGVGGSGVGGSGVSTVGSIPHSSSAGGGSSGHGCSVSCSVSGMVGDASALSLM